MSGRIERLRFGTRGSKLALWQTRHVVGLLGTRRPEIAVDEVLISTLGDRVTDVPLFRVGGQGLFVAEIERALQERRIDVAVHSLKDLPHAMAEGLCLAAVTTREDARDVLVSRNGTTLADLPAGARIGTSSLRRRAQLMRLRPDLAFVDCRGNLDTRLRKLDAGEFDAIVLAAAGLRRLGWADRITEWFDPPALIPAAGQGMLGIQCRSDDLALIELLEDTLDDPLASHCAAAERGFLHRLQGGCQTPMGVHATHADDETLRLTAFVALPDGSKYLKTDLSGPANYAADLGCLAAEDLLEKGAASLLAAPPDPGLTP
ncbi:MAG TPA: hydroxymethylbilane synthase [Candidatus Ozemobacteraceae bacterium]|nr:hydroxymethylbilane synthase [Candidatus Ozemobacteraceae bacterium]